MHASPLRMGILYIVMGIFFTFLAIHRVSISSWNVMAVIFLIFATFDFGVGIRAFMIYFSQKKKDQ